MVLIKTQLPGALFQAIRITVMGPLIAADPLQAVDLLHEQATPGKYNHHKMMIPTITLAVCGFSFYLRTFFFSRGSRLSTKSNRQQQQSADQNKTTKSVDI